MDLSGGVLTALALARAPVSVVQPIISMGLLHVALYSHFVLRERLSESEWKAGGMAVLGERGARGAKFTLTLAVLASPFLFWNFSFLSQLTLNVL
jgi:hypothetical protein